MQAPRVVIIGAYGFIGAACARAFREAGYSVAGIGRNRHAAEAMYLDLDWLFLDVGRATVEDLKRAFLGADVVVNCSGALQDGARDTLRSIHVTAVETILEALSGSQTRFIQVSAAGVSLESNTDFFRTKAKGDALIAASSLNWVILRPVLVLGREAYGGTALLRAAAAMPVAGVRVLENAPVQTVHVEDLANAVLAVARGDLGTQFTADITEDNVRSFQDTVEAARKWLGYPVWRRTVAMPSWILTATSLLADSLGRLGWRSPLRTNAILSLENGITGDPETWKRRGGEAFGSLEGTLASMPATAQERLFARVYLLLPLAIACLSLFWIASGLIGFVNHEAAAAVLSGSALPGSVVTAAVFGGSISDFALGSMVLYRPWTRTACIGMILVSAAYIAGGTVFANELWADPLGPLVKVFPGMVLALLVALLLERR